jgi:hypothetical protein
MVCKKIGVSKEEKEYRILIRPGPTANADALSPDAELYQDRDGRVGTVISFAPGSRARAISCRLIQGRWDRR